MEPNTVIRCIRVAGFCVFLALFLYFVTGAVVSLVGAARLELTAQISHALGGLDADALGGLDADALGGFDADALGGLDADALGGLDADALGDILNSACSF